MVETNALVCRTRGASGTVFPNFAAFAGLGDVNMRVREYLYHRSTRYLVKANFGHYSLTVVTVPLERTPLDNSPRSDVRSDL